MSNVPKLRFDGFSEDWIDRRLGNIASFFSGGTPTSTDKSYYSGTIPFIGSGKINAVAVNQYITEEALQNSSAKLVAVGDLLYALYGATSGQVAISKINGAINQAVLCIRSNENKYFLKTWLEHHKERILATYLQGGQGNLSAQIVKLLKLKLPTLPEQQKIAAFLTAVDTKIEQLTQKEALLKQYKKGVMQKIFSQEIRFKADDGEEFPEWEMRPLGSVFKEVTERVGAQDIETYSISAGKGFVSQKEKFGRDISGQQNEKYTVLRPHQFSYNKGNSKTYTYGCVYPNTLGHPIALPNVFISFELIDSKYSVAFFAKLFENHYLDRSLRRIISSSARMDGLLNVNKADFFRIGLPVPSHEEQQKAGEFLSELDVKLVLLQQELDAAKTFKKGLLQQMFV